MCPLSWQLKQTPVQEGQLRAKCPGCRHEWQSGGSEGAEAGTGDAERSPEDGARGGLAGISTDVVCKAGFNAGEASVPFAVSMGRGW